MSVPEVNVSIASETTMPLLEARARPVTREDIVARIERLPLSSWHLKIVGIVGLASFFDAFDSLTIAFVLPVLVGLWHISPGEIGLLISTGYIGQLIGAIALSAYAERIGRVRALRMAVGTLALLSLACAFAGNFPTLLALRFVQGLGLGAEVPIAATYINEGSAARFRGRLVFVLEVMFAGGVVMTSLIALWVIPHFGWEAMFVIGGLPLILALFLGRIVPESPRWLAGRGRCAEADAILTNIESQVSARGARPLAAPVPLIHQLDQPPAGLRGLLQDGLAGRTMTAWAIMFCTSLAGYGLISWMPTIYRTVYHATLQDSLFYSILGGAAGLLAAVIGAAVIDVIGRRWTFALGFAGCAVPLFIMSALPVGGAITEVVALATTSMFFISILLAGVYAYVPEIYPTRMRALGAGVASAWLRIASILGPTIVGVLLQADGISAVFAFFGLASACGALIVIVCLIETRGRALEDIAQ